MAIAALPDQGGSAVELMYAVTFQVVHYQFIPDLFN
jgi:hypothetical protein